MKKESAETLTELQVTASVYVNRRFGGVKWGYERERGYTGGMAGGIRGGGAQAAGATDAVRIYPNIQAGHG